MHITEFRVSLHSDGGREDGTEGEPPGLPNLLLEVCMRCVDLQRIYGMSRHTIVPLSMFVSITIVDFRFITEFCLFSAAEIPRTPLPIR